MKTKAAIGWLCATLLGASAAHAEIVVGAILSQTGPAASLGIPSKNAIDLMPKQIGGEPVRYVVLDDGSDPSAAVRAARKLIDEHKADVIIGPSITPTSLATQEVLGPGKTASFSMGGSTVIVNPVEGNKRYAFKPAAGEDVQAVRVFDHLVKAGVKSVGFVAFNDAFGGAFVAGFKKEAANRNISVAADERYSKTDTSVTAQVLKVIATSPGAVIVGAAGTPGVSPVLELRKLGYRGLVFINQGMAVPEVLRLGGAALNGVLLASPPVLVAEQLPDANPIRKVALEHVNAYEAVHGPNSRSLLAATAWDAFLLIQKGVEEALKTSKPGTEAFRTALRDAIENTHELVGSMAVYNLSPSNHNGTDLRGEVLVKISGEGWTYVPSDE